MVTWIAMATGGDASADSGRKARLAYGWSCLRAGTSTIPATGGPARRVLTSMMGSAALATSDEGAEVREVWLDDWQRCYDGHASSLGCIRSRSLSRSIRAVVRIRRLEHRAVLVSADGIRTLFCSSGGGDGEGMQTGQ